MYYNYLIKQEGTQGEYDLFENGEQAVELQDAGFRILNEINGLYAGHAELVVAQKI